MAQHQQPRHLSSQSGSGHDRKPRADEQTASVSGRRAASSEAPSVRRAAPEEKPAPVSRVSLEDEFLFDDWDPFADESFQPRRTETKKPAPAKEPAPAPQPAAEREAPAEQPAPERKAPAEQPAAARRAPAEGQPAARRRAPAEQQPAARRVPADGQPAARRRAPAEQQPAAGRRASAEGQPAAGRKAPAEQQPAAGRRASAEGQPAAGRRASAEQQPAAGRRAAAGQQRAAGDQRGAQNRQNGATRWPTPEGYDDYIDTTDRSPGKGSLALVAILKVLVSLVLVAMTAGFCYFLYSTGMLPDMFFLAACAVLGVLLVIILCLMWLSRKSGPLYTGIVLALILAGGMTFGYKMLSKTVGTIQSITDVTTAVSSVNVYVMQNDQAQDLGDVAGYTFGIVEVMGREAVDQTISEINTSLGAQIQTAEYPSISMAVDALRGGSVQALIVGQSQMDALKEVQGYQDLGTEVRAITNMQVEHQIVETPAVAAAAPATSELEPFTVYISGIDSRDGMVPESRSDLNIIATVNPQTRQVLLVSTPRDYYVPLSVSNGQLDKLTHAGLYGVNVSVDTLEMLYGIDIDYYFRVYFEGFEDIIDALGGVTVDSDARFWDYTYTYYFDEGPNELNGEEALAFARERKAFEDGDRARGRHQMVLIKAIADKILSTDLLKNYSSVMDAVSTCFETSMSYDMVASLVQDQLANGGSWDIQSYSVDGTENWEGICYTMPETPRYVLEPDQATVDTATGLMKDVLAGETVTVPAE